jgi:hypothetical protein
MILVSCPSGCLQQTQNVYGVGIHPDASSICASAIVDRSSPVTGGTIAVGNYLFLNLFSNLSFLYFTFYFIKGIMPGLTKY